MDSLADPSIGHNSGTPADLARAEILEATAAARRRADDIVAAMPRVIVSDAESAGKAADFVKTITTCRKAVDDAHAEVKGPYLAAGKVVDDAVRQLRADLDNAKAVTLKAVNDWRAAEDAKAREAARIEREAREAAERAEREAQAKADAAARAAAEATNAAERRKAQAAAEAAAKAQAEAAARAREAEAAVAAPAAQIVGDYGSKASGRTTWKGEIIDQDEAYKAVRSTPAVVEAIQKAVDGLVRAGIRDLAGVKIFAETKTVVR